MAKIKTKRKRKFNPAVNGVINVVFPFGSSIEQSLSIGRKNFLFLDDLGYAFDVSGNIIGMLRSYILNDNTQIINRRKLPRSLEF